MIEGSIWLLKDIFGGFIFWVFQQNLGLFDQFHKEIVGFFDNRVHFYSFYVFEKKSLVEHPKRNQMAIP